MALALSMIWLPLWFEFEISPTGSYFEHEFSNLRAISKAVGPLGDTAWLVEVVCGDSLIPNSGLFVLFSGLSRCAQMLLSIPTATYSAIPSSPRWTKSFSNWAKVNYSFFVSVIYFVFTNQKLSDIIGRFCILLV